MRILRNFLLLVLLITVSCVKEAHAFSSTEEVTEDRKESFAANLNLDTINEEPEKRAINCFDVCEDGMIAIGVSNSNGKAICIYSTDGVFQYGYSFNCNGNFGIEWDGDYLAIYFVRGSIGVRLSLDGLIDSVFLIPQSTENTKYWNNVVFSTKRTIQDLEYTLLNDSDVLGWFSSTYSKLIVTNPQGQIRTIYDVSSNQLRSSLFLLSAIFVFVGTVLIGVVKKNSQTKC